MTRTARSLCIVVTVTVLCVGIGCTAQAPSQSSTPPAAVPANAGAATPRPYKPTATFQEVMDSIVDPAADYVWNSVGTTIDIKGIHERRPRTDTEWHEVRQHAIQLVETANLISVPGRKVATGKATIEHGEALDVSHIQERLDKNHDQLVGLADLMRQTGQQLVAAADHKDVGAIFDLGGQLDMVCESCHRAFWYPDEPSPDTPTK